MEARTGRFRRSDRLLRPAEFQRVVRHGRRGVSDGVVVLACRGVAGREGPRLGITVSRRVGGAVQRNRVKRQVREWFRHERGRLATGQELVVIGRREAVALSSRELWHALEAAARRAGAWQS